MEIYLSQVSVETLFRWSGNTYIGFMKIYSEQQMPNFGTSEYVLHREPYYKNNFGVFLRVIVYDFLF